MRHSIRERRQHDAGRRRLQIAETLLDQSIHLLETQGIAIEDPEAVDLLHSAHLIRDQEGALLHFRVRAVRRQLASLCSGFDLYDREGRKSATLSAAGPAPPTPALWASVPGAIGIPDPDSPGDLAPVPGIELPRAVRRIVDTRGFDLYGVGPIASDLPVALADTYAFYLYLLATHRPVLLRPRHAESLDGVRTLLARVRGSALAIEERPLAIIELPQATPEAWSAHEGRLLIDSVRRGFPVALRPLSADPAYREAGGGPGLLHHPGRLARLVAGMLAGLLVAQECRLRAPLLWGLPFVAEGQDPARWTALRLLLDVGHVVGLPTYACVTGPGPAWLAAGALALGLSMAGARLVAWGGGWHSENPDAAGVTGCDLDALEAQADAADLMGQSHLMARGHDSIPRQPGVSFSMIDAQLRVDLAGLMRREAERFEAVHLPLSV